MTTMISEVYEAFIDAGVSPDKAKSAAEALSSENLATKQDINKIEQELVKIDAKFDKQLAIVKVLLAVILTAVAYPILKEIFS